LSHNISHLPGLQITSSDLERIKEDIHRKMVRENILRVFNSWINGRAVNAKLSDVKPVIIRSKEIEEKIQTAIKHLQERLWEGIFTIRTRRLKYGTGKTQLARFLYWELNTKNNFITDYFSLNINNLAEVDKRISEILTKAKDRNAYAAVFIDEVDLLINPSFSEEEQRKYIEQFANIVITYSEYAFNENIPLSIFLVLSHKADQKINEVSRDRLGRRITNTLIEADIFLSRKDLLELAAKIAALHLLIMEEKSEKLRKHRSETLFLLRGFVSDISQWLWDDATLRGMSIGEAVSKLVTLTKLILEGINWENFPRIYRKVISGHFQIMGIEIEQLLRNFLENFCSRLEFEKEGYKLICKFNNKQLYVDGRRCDSYYDITLGETIPLGKTLIEVTTVENINSKKNQLKTYLTKHPTILLYAHHGNLDELNTLNNELGEQSTNFFFDLPIHRELLKYALLLEKPSAFQYIKEIFDLELEITPLLEKIAHTHLKEWLSITPTPPPTTPTITPTTKPFTPPQTTATQPTKTNIEELKTRLYNNLLSKIQKLQLDKTYKAKETIIRELTKTFDILTLHNIKIEHAERRQIIIDIINKWEENQLGKQTPKQFRPNNTKLNPTNPTWNNEKAANIAIQEILPLIKRKSTNNLKHQPPKTELNKTSHPK